MHNEFLVQMIVRRREITWISSYWRSIYIATFLYLAFRHIILLVLKSDRSRVWARLLDNLVLKCLSKLEDFLRKKLHVNRWDFIFRNVDAPLPSVLVFILFSLPHFRICRFLILIPESVLKKIPSISLIWRRSKNSIIKKYLPYPAVLLPQRTSRKPTGSCTSAAHWRTSCSSSTPDS